ncbi:hypothetical protein BC831DRAFT_484412 [Entophlyctis helioformis]|nr:hypothetical protein BC831DRAFT_484412 [Entophlyctis helioformis]
MTADPALALSPMAAIVADAIVVWASCFGTSRESLNQDASRFGLPAVAVDAACADACAADALHLPATLTITPDADMSIVWYAQQHSKPSSHRPICIAHHTEHHTPHHTAHHNAVQDNPPVRMHPGTLAHDRCVPSRLVRRASGTSPHRHHRRRGRRGLPSPERQA